MITDRRAALLHTVSEAQLVEHVFTLGALGGFHGLRIRQSHGRLEGLHSPRRPFPRGADHDDASGLPDLLLVQPDRGILALIETKAPRGRLREGQSRWGAWLSSAHTVYCGVWTPAMEPEIRRVLLP